jgi:hypothetical protein
MSPGLRCHQTQSPCYQFRDQQERWLHSWVREPLLPNQVRRSCPGSIPRESLRLWHWAEVVLARHREMRSRFRPVVRNFQTSPSPRSEAAQ